MKRKLCALVLCLAFASPVSAADVPPKPHQVLTKAEAEKVLSRHPELKPDRNYSEVHTLDGRPVFFIYINPDDFRTMVSYADEGVEGVPIVIQAVYRVEIGEPVFANPPRPTPQPRAPSKADAEKVLSRHPELTAANDPPSEVHMLDGRPVIFRDTINQDLASYRTVVEDTPDKVEGVPIIVQVATNRLAPGLISASSPTPSPRR